jgi:hypothetical protein
MDGAMGIALLLQGLRLQPSIIIPWYKVPVPFCPPTETDA